MRWRISEVLMAGWPVPGTVTEKNTTAVDVSSTSELLVDEVFKMR